MKTLVYVDHFKGDIQPSSWEALGLAKSFGTAVALVFGAGVDEVAKAALEYGADEVLVADDPSLKITAQRHMPPLSPRSPLPKALT
jgi:electron transfer flavoprotein alpha subunit